MYMVNNADTLNDIRNKLHKFSQEEAAEMYCLNFSTLALLKSCEVMGMNCEMIFRGIDINSRG